MHKLDLARSLGYTVIVVWSDDLPTYDEIINKIFNKENNKCMNR